MRIFATLRADACVDIYNLPGLPMSYVKDHLIAGEQVLYRTRLHWCVLLVPSLIAVICGGSGLGLLAGGIMQHKGGAVWGGGIFLLLAVTAFGLALLRRDSVEAAITNKRVLIKVGVLQRRTLELFLTQIEGISVEEPLLGKLLGYGTVIVRGTGGTKEAFQKINQPLEFRRQIQGHMDTALSQRR